MKMELGQRQKSISSDEKIANALIRNLHSLRYLLNVNPKRYILRKSVFKWRAYFHYYDLKGKSKRPFFAFNVKQMENKCGKIL